MALVRTAWRRLVAETSASIATGSGKPKRNSPKCRFELTPCRPSGSPNWPTRGELQSINQHLLPLRNGFQRRILPV